MSESETEQDTSVLKFKVMVIDTKELKKILEDKDFDGITLQVSQAINNNTPQDKHKFKLIAYKHFSSKKKQEQITDANFFVNNDGTETYKEVELGDDGVTSHFGNLKLRRSDLKEEADTSVYPYLVLWPEEGTGDYENYIVYEAFYTNDLKAAPPHKQTLSRGVSTSSTMSLKPINPSPPA